MEPSQTLAEELANWDRYMVLIGSFFVAAGVLIFLYYEFRVLKQKEDKDRYDYVNTHEIRYFWYSVFLFIFAAFFFSNTIFTSRVFEKGWTWFGVRLFITASMAFILYFFLSSVVRIYYPKILEKRLNKLRTRPRISPAGNPMRRLTEDEEDAHLDASQIAEEGSGIHSVDYDVWLDEKTGQKKVEKYMAYQRAEECPECGYYTMKIYNEEVEKVPTTSDTGLLLKHFRCNYCRHREVREVILAKLSASTA